MSVTLSESNNDNSENQPIQPQREALGYLTEPSGSLSWLFTLDHKRIAVMYLAVMIVGLLFGSMLGLILQIERWTKESNWLDAQNYHQLFTNHGLVMVFLVMLPAIPAVIGNFLLPICLGTKGLPFPRLGLTGFYSYVIALNLLIVAIDRGGADSGWDFRADLTATSGGSVTLTLVAVLLASTGCLLNSFNFIAAVHCSWTTGLNMQRTPLLVWSLYLTSWLQLFAIPVLGASLLILLGDRVLEMGFLQSEFGGQTELYEQMVGFFMHLSTTIVLLPALGVTCDVISSQSRRPMAGRRVVAWSLIAVAICGPLGWGQQLSPGGHSGIFNAIFSLFSFVVIIPLAVIVVSWLVTIIQGAQVWSTPQLYSLMFIFTLAIAALSGLFLNSLATRTLLQDTTFATANQHYLWGSVFFGFVAGLHYWWPKISGRSYHEGLGVFIAWLMFSGFNLAFFPQFLAGSHGLPKRAAINAEPFQLYQEISACGGCLLVVSLVALVSCLLHSFVKGERALANPWNSESPEWQVGSPPTWSNR